MLDNGRLRWRGFSGVALAGLLARDPLDRAGDPGRTARKSGNSINASSSAAAIQKRVDMGEQGKKARHRNDLELQLVGAVGHALRAASASERRTIPNMSTDTGQDDGRDDHEGVRFTRRRDEGR